VGHRTRRTGGPQKPDVRFLSSDPGRGRGNHRLLFHAL
jgi:hypothetical protein